jgi:hypothetical protein
VKKAPADTDTADTTPKKQEKTTAGRMTVEEEKVMNALVTAWCYSVLSIYLTMGDFNIVTLKLPQKFQLP